MGSHAMPDRQSITVTIVIDSQHMFNYENDFDFIPDGGYETAESATDAALCDIEQRFGSVDAVDVTIIGGVWDTRGNYPTVKFIEGPSFRDGLDGGVYALGLDELQGRVEDAIKEAEDNSYMLTAHHEVPLGQLVDAAVRLHQEMYPKRKKRDNTPTLGQFLDRMFDDLVGDERTRQRHHKAFLIVVSSDWPAMDDEYTGEKTGLARVFDAAKQFANKGKTPKRKRTPIVERYKMLREIIMEEEPNIRTMRAWVEGFDDEDA